jgi:hypothetical protein
MLVGPWSFTATEAGRVHVDVRVWQQAAEKGQVLALASLGGLYHKQQDLARAEKYWRAASAQGLRWADTALFRLMAEQGRRAEAMALAETSASRGNKDLQEQLGLWLWNGWAGKKRRDVALEWLEKAAANGSETAMVSERFLSCLPDASDRGGD